MPIISKAKFISPTLVIQIFVLPALNAQQGNVALGTPLELVVASGMAQPQRTMLLDTARLFYQFWNTGDTATLNQAVSPNFTDHDLPPGRPQGPTGPAFAIRQFKAIVPDLQCDVTQQIIAQDRVISHLRFRGHFNGSLGNLKGQGQAIDFVATDILRIEDGHITDNWHIEDNLTFLRQIGAVAP